MGFDKQHIRPLAVGILRKGNKVLSLKGFDHKKGQTFYRLLGGGIEFGERAETTVVREFKEELDINVKVVRHLGVDENIFIYEGCSGHEIAFFFEVELVNPDDAQKQFVFVEDELRNNEVVWAEIDGKDPIYPQGFRRFIL